MTKLLPEVTSWATSSWIMTRARRKVSQRRHKDIDIRRDSHITAELGAEGAAEAFAKASDYFDAGNILRVQELLFSVLESRRKVRPLTHRRALWTTRATFLFPLQLTHKTASMALLKTTVRVPPITLAFRLVPRCCLFAFMLRLVTLVRHASSAVWHRNAEDILSYVVSSTSHPLRNIVVLKTFARSVR